MKIVKVSFSSNGCNEMGAANWDSRQYDYFMVDESLEVEKGDLAVVQAAGKLQIVKVVGFSKLTGNATKFLLTAFNMERVEQKVEAKKIKEELLASISQRMERALFLKNAAALAEHDSELASMLNSLKELG